MSGYPILTITNYRAGKISRQQFIRQFSDWQKSRGIDYGCKGLARHGFVGVTYRGVNATIRGGALYFVTETCEDEKGVRRHTRQKAESFSEFERKVDMAICDRLRGKPWN